MNSSNRGVYVASRASIPERGQMWRRLRNEGWPIVSSWIDEDGEGQTGDFGELWDRINREIQESCGLVLYVSAEDFPLKGALVEAGMALGMNKPVRVVADVMLEPRSMRPLGSWASHGNVSFCESVEQALSELTAKEPA